MTTSPPRTCSRCGTPDLTTYCGVCECEFAKRTPVDTMDAEARVNELRTWAGPLEIPFSLVHQRIEELMGRPVWTHELADFDLLEHEILTGSVPTMDGILAKLPHDKPVIGVVVDSAES